MNYYSTFFGFCNPFATFLLFKMIFYIWEKEKAPVSSGARKTETGSLCDGSKASDNLVSLKRR